MVIWMGLLRQVLNGERGASNLTFSLNSQFYIAKIIIKSPINCGYLSKLALVDQRTHLKGF